MRARRGIGDRLVAGLFVFLWETVVVAAAAVIALVIAVAVLALV